MAVQPISTINFRGAAGREDKGGRDQRIGILAPDRVLSMPIEHTQHPVMTCEISKIPCHGSIGLAERIGAIDQCDIIELGAAHALWLYDPEQTGVMQIAFGFRGPSPPGFR